MARKMKVHHPTTTEIQRLSKEMIKLVNPHQRRRAEALILFGMGLTPLEIAMAQGVHPNTVYMDLHAFEQLAWKRFGSCGKLVRLVELPRSRSRRWSSWPNDLHKKWVRHMGAGR